VDKPSLPANVLAVTSDADNSDTLITPHHSDTNESAKEKQKHLAQRGDRNGMDEYKGEGIAMFRML
jgi:hypothetical protein